MDLTPTKFEVVKSGSIPPAEQNLIFRPQGNVIEIMESRHPNIIVDGPAGTGKSRGILERINAMCLKYPNLRCLVVRKTRSSLTQSLMVTFDTYVRHPEQTLFIASKQQYIYPNQSVIVMGGLDKASRILSTEYDVIYIGEAVEVTEEDYEILDTRNRNGAIPFQILFADCNPSHAKHWLKRRWEANLAHRIKTVHTDNPRIYDEAKQEYTTYGVSYLAKLDKLTGLRRKRLRDGLWVSAEGVIYGEWDDSIHAKRYVGPVEDLRMFCSVDFGYTNAFVCQWWVVDSDGRMYMLAEIYHTQRTVRAHSQQIREVNARMGWSPEIYVCDHDAEDRATMDEEDLPTIPANKTVSIGIEKIKERLILAGDGKARLFISPNAVIEPDPILVDSYQPASTLEEIPDYSWANKTQAQIIKEQPVKEDDHGCDAMRYAVMYIESGSADGGIHI